LQGFSINSLLFNEYCSSVVVYNTCVFDGCVQIVKLTETIDMVPAVRESQGKIIESGKVGEFKSTRVQKLTKMQKKF